MKKKSQTKKPSPEQILRFLEDFRQLHSVSRKAQGPAKLISLKVSEDLLRPFRTLCDRKGLKYQTQIKILMRDWILKLS